MRPSLLPWLTSSLLALALVACSGSPGGTSEIAPEKNPPVGDDSDASNGCVSTGVESDNAPGDACIADLEARCKAALDACSADCTCTGFTSRCMDTSFSLGPYECMSAAQGPLETAIFDCMEPSTVCQNARPPRDAGAGD